MTTGFSHHIHGRSVCPHECFFIVYGINVGTYIPVPWGPLKKHVFFLNPSSFLSASMLESPPYASHRFPDSPPGYLGLFTDIFG